MTALLALAGIVGGCLTSLLAVFALGPWGLLFGPFGGSVAIVAAGVAAGSPARPARRNEAIDGMVADLRSILPAASSPDADDQDERRAAH